MRVDPKTLLFVDLSEQDSIDLISWAENVVLRGHLPPEDPPWIDAWLAAAKLGDNQRLLVLSTVIPQRALLSVLHHHRLGAPP